jgi:hypothetical protein
MSKNGQSIEHLEQPGNVNHQRWEWMIERVGWAGMGGIIVAALLGGLGPGPLGWRDVASSDGSLSANYYAVERAAAPSKLVLKLGSSPSREMKHEVTISRAFSDAAKLESIVPEPLSVAIRDDQIVYTFAAADATPGASVTFHYQHQKFGPLSYQVARGDQGPVRIRQFVLP